MHDYECPGVPGTTVHGGGLAPCGFVSVGWPTKKAAAERGQQHQAEHETGEPMPELNQTEES